MKIKLIILLLVFGSLSILYGMEQEHFYSKSTEESFQQNIQLNSLINLPVELQIHIISHIISEEVSIKKAMKYLQSLSRINKHFNELIYENRDLIIWQWFKSLSTELKIQAIYDCIINNNILFEKFFKPSSYFKESISKYIVNNNNMENIIFELENKFISNHDMHYKINSNIINNTYNCLSQGEITYKLGVETQWNDYLSKTLTEDTVRIAAIVPFNQNIIAVVKTHDNKIINQKEIIGLNWNSGFFLSTTYSTVSDHIQYSQYSRYVEKKLRVYEHSKCIDLKRRNGKWDKIEFYIANNNIPFATYQPSGHARKVVIYFKTNNELIIRAI